VTGDENPPDGISNDHMRARRWSRHASPLALLVLCMLVGAALSGVLGGGKNRVVHAQSAEVGLAVSSPEPIRNGDIFETRIMIEVKEPIADLVVALPPSLWRDLTINSFIPAASEESFANGRFEFHFGSLAKSEELEIKLANQINPALIGRNRGKIIVADGDRALVSLPVVLTVLP
jgi:hypothetical protein